MLDDKPNNIAKALGAVIAVIVLMLAFMGYAFGQHKHVDKGLEGLENRVWAVDVLYLEPIEAGHRLELKVSDKNQVRYETFTITRSGEIDPAILKSPKGKFAWLVWCNEDRFVYLLLAIKPEQIVKRK